MFPWGVPSGNLACECFFGVSVFEPLFKFISRYLGYRHSAGWALAIRETVIINLFSVFLAVGRKYRF
jgi:hypothetical protein